MFYEVSEAKNTGLIPKEYFFMFEEDCPYCSSPVLISEELTQMKCSNIRCPAKLAGRMVQMLNNFGVVGIGRSFAEKFLKEHGFNSHIYVLFASNEELSLTGRLSQAWLILQEMERIKKEEYFFYEVVQKLALPRLNVTAKVIFKNVFCYSELLYLLEQKQMTMRDYLRGLRGIGKKNCLELEKILEEYSLELQLAERFFKLREPVKGEVKVMMTGHLDFFEFSKQEYINYLNRVFKGHRFFVRTDSVADCDYAVTANKYLRTSEDDYSLDYEEETGMFSKKHNLAIRKCKKLGEDILFTPEEFVAEMKETCESELRINGKN